MRPNNGDDEYGDSGSPQPKPEATPEEVAERRKRFADTPRDVSAIAADVWADLLSRSIDELASADDPLQFTIEAAKRHSRANHPPTPEYLGRLRQRVGTMDGNVREVFLMHYSGLTYQDIARKLHRKPDDVLLILTQAYSHLRLCSSSALG